MGAQGASWHLRARYPGLPCLRFRNEPRTLRGSPSGPGVMKLKLDENLDSRGQPVFRRSIASDRLADHFNDDPRNRCPGFIRRHGNGSVLPSGGKAYPVAKGET